MIVVIPTCKKIADVQLLVKEIRDYTPASIPIIPTCSDASAAVNRNIGLNNAKNGEVVIMADDDMTGFFNNWYNILTAPLIHFPDVCAVSARLLNTSGKLGPMIGCNKNIDDAYIEAESVMPSACIAFVNNGLRFDENFIGSGFEDTDFMRQLLTHNPGYRLIVNNRCRLIHKHEMKNQGGQFFEHNKNYFCDKWQDETYRDMKPYVK